MSAGTVGTRRRQRWVPSSVGRYTLLLTALALFVGSTEGLLRPAAVTGVALLIADALICQLAARSTRVEIVFPEIFEQGVTTDLPTAVSGSESHLGLQATGQLTSSLTFAAGGSSGAMVVSASVRGVHPEATVAVVRSGWFGMVISKSTLVFAPVEPLLVAPRPLHSAVIDDLLIRHVSASDEMELVGVRPYQAGDRPADVHWPSVARAGEVMVRERRPELTEPSPVQVRISGPDDELFDRSLAIGRYAIERARQYGAAVTVVTRNASSDDPVVTRVGSERGWLAELARAVPGSLPETVAAGDQLVIRIESAVPR